MASTGSLGTDVQGWMTAIGTVAAAATAVFYGSVIDFFRRPSLSLLFDRQNASDQLVVGTVAHFQMPGQVGPAFRDEQAWLRFRIRNRPSRVAGRAAAEDVQIQVTDVRELEPRKDQSLGPKRSLTGFSLKWSNTSDETRGLIAPGQEVFIDFACVTRSRAVRGDAPLVLAVEPKPTDGRHMVTALSVEVELTIIARNANPRTYLLTAYCDGGWADPPWRHVCIRSVKAK